MEQSGRRRRRRLGAEQTEGHRGFAVVLLLAAVSDLLQTGGVVSTGEKKCTYETPNQCKDMNGSMMQAHQQTKLVRFKGSRSARTVWASPYRPAALVRYEVVNEVYLQRVCQ